MRRKASIYVHDDLWRSFVIFVVRKHGTARKTSAEAEIAIREYLERHKSNTAFAYTATGKSCSAHKKMPWRRTKARGEYQCRNLRRG